MSTFDYARTAATSRRLIARFGATLYLRRLSGETYNPVTGALTVSGTTTDHPVTGVAIQIDAAYKTLVGHENVNDGDRLYLLDDTRAPLLSDSLVVASEPWSIVRVAEVNPAGTPLIYQVQVRR